MSRLGAIPALNALPLTEPLRRWRGGEVVWDTPAALAERLATGELAHALVPPVEALAHASWRALWEGR